MYVYRRTTLTIVLSIGLLLLGLAAPVAGSERPVVTDTVGERMPGLPSSGEARESEEGDRAFATASADAADVSEPVATPIPFSMLGFEVPDGAEVWYRTSPDGQEWSDWHEAHANPDEGPDPASAEAAAAADRTLSEPVWVGEGTHVQTRVTGAATDDVPVHLIDSLGLHRSWAQRAADAVAAAWEGTPRPAAAAVGAPPVVSRAQWGADESWRKGTPSIASGARVGIVHHTVGGNTYSQSEAASVVRGVYHYHTKSNGWSDMGYNLLVDRFGTIYEGRYGGLERAVIGAHAGGFNTGTFGVALMGDHGTSPASSAALEALQKVLAWKFDVHHIDASATSRMTSGGSTRFSSGTTVTLHNVSGHQDVSATACPGTTVYDKLPTVRQQVAARQSPMFVQPEVSPRSIRLSSSSATTQTVSFAADLKPAGGWTLTVTDDKGVTVHTAAGSGSRATSTWQPPATPAIYSYTLASTDGSRRPATGEITVLRDVVERRGTAGSPVGGAIELSKAAFEKAESAEHAVLARSDVFADAMAGGPLAGTSGPLLLTGGKSLESDVRAELDRVLPAGATVYVLGGEAAISPDVSAALTGTWKVERLSGPERTATAARVAEAVRARDGGTTVMVARAGPDDKSPWADALAGGAYGAHAGIPVLLTYTDRLTEPTRAALAGVSRSIVLGGTAAVSDSVMVELPGAQRVSGGDRVGTAVQIAEQLWGRRTGSAEDLVIVSGGFSESSWTLTLAGSPLAARNRSPILLTAATSLSSATAEHLDRLDYGSGRSAKGVVLGDRGVVADSVVAEVSRRLQ